MHSWSINYLFYNIIKAINTTVNLKFYWLLRAHKAGLRDYIFSLTGMLCLETERKFTQVG